MKTKNSIWLLTLTITLATSITTKGQNLKVSPDLTFASKCEEKSIAVKSAIIATECSGTIEANSTAKKWAVKVRSNIIKHPEFEEVRQIKMQKLSLKLQTMKSQSQSQESFSTAAVTPVIGINFEANWMRQGTPSDDAMAISNGGYIVTANNDGVEYYDQSGTFLYFDFWDDFFNDSQLTASLYDPKILYDSGADRFIMIVLHGNTASTSKVIVCFSKTNNPQNGWWTYKLTGNPLNDDSWFDYPSVGVSNNEFYVTGNLFSTGGNVFNQAIIYQIQKSAGLSGGSLVWQYWANINSTPFTAATIVPVSNGHQGNYGPGIYFVSSKSAGSDKIRLYNLTDDMTAANEQLNHYTINTTSYSPSPNSSQLGNSDLLDNGDCRIQNGFYLNGTIHFVFHSDIGSGWNGINYNRLTVSNTTNQSSTFGLSGSFDYSYPSVVPFSTVATDKSVMIGFLRASSSIYPEVRVVNCDDNLNWSSSTLVKSGETYVDFLTGEERWGDYTGISRRHNSATAKIWLSGCYGANINLFNYNTYKTWVAEVYSNSTTSVENTFSIAPKTVVFPNPVYDFFSIKFTADNSEETVISIYDQQGKLVRTLFKDAVKKGENIFSFNKNALSNGTYFLVITNNQKNIANEKIIIID